MEKGSNVNTKKIDKKISINLIFNILYKLVVYLSPLIVTPYISRTLNPSLLGTYAYTFSIATLFIFVSASICNYGKREIALNTRDKHKCSVVFYEMFSIKFIFTIIMTSLYFVLFCVLKNDYHKIFYIELLLFLGVIFDVNWFFEGKEEYKKISIRNIILRILNIILIFILVKSENDFIKYIWISVIINFLSYISMIIYLPKYLEKISMKEMKISKHILGCFILMLPYISVELFSYLDKAMLEWFSIPEENGYYLQAEKVIKMCLEVLLTLNAVVTPRISSYFAENNEEDISKLISKCFLYIIMLGTPIIIGLVIINDRFVDIFFGEGYDKCIILINIFLIGIIPKALNDTMANSYLIPTKHHLLFLISSTIAAIINVLLNAIFIPTYGSIAAATSSILAEYIIFISLCIGVNSKIHPFKNIICSWKYLISGAIMGIFTWIINYFIAGGLISFIVIICSAAILYFIGLIILRDSLVYDGLQIIRRKIKHDY